MALYCCSCVEYGMTAQSGFACPFLNLYCGNIPTYEAFLWPIGPSLYCFAQRLFILVCDTAVCEAQQLELSYG
eukprot:m.1651077 g.1651077  ORF g.1651077 m.1651077 type:complete len:73 (-) comp89317_c0_seq1:11-229(-)